MWNDLGKDFCCDCCMQVSAWTLSGARTKLLRVSEWSTWRAKQTNK